MAMEPRRHPVRYEVPGHARYLTFSCFHRLPLFGNDDIKRQCVEHLRQARRRDGFKLFAWVIMPEHLHLLLLPALPEKTASRTLARFKRPFAELVLRRWRELDAPILDRLRDGRGKTRFWQRGGGYDRNLFTVGEIEEKIRYIHNNPVVRELARTPEDWSWSSARWYAGDRSCGIEIDDWTVRGCEA